jgi:hypothetical protein
MMRLCTSTPVVLLTPADFTNGESGCRSVAAGNFGYDRVQKLPKALVCRVVARLRRTQCNDAMRASRAPIGPHGYHNENAEISIGI